MKNLDRVVLEKMMAEGRLSVYVDAIDNYAMLCVLQIDRRKEYQFQSKGIEPTLDVPKIEGHTAIEHINLDRLSSSFGCRTQKASCLNGDKQDGQ